MILVKALNEDEAMKFAEQEAREYEDDSDSQIKYLGFVNVFNMFDEDIKNGTEIFSMMRNSNLEPKEYLDKFYDTGKERSRK